MKETSFRSPVTFEGAALGGAIVFAAYLVSRYDICFQNAEVLTGSMFDGGGRARLLNYAANILTLESRLMLWNVLPPHPSFTPVWLLTLLAGPALLYRFLLNELGNHRAALAGVAVYLVSAGNLSGVTMLFNQAKPLANVAVIGTLYLSSRINTAVRPQPDAGSAGVPPRPQWIALLLLLAAAPFTDETGVFAFAIPLVWCPGLFWELHPARLRASLRNWAAYAMVAGFVVVLLLLILPPVFAAVGGHLALLEFLHTKAVEGAQYGKLDLRHLVWQAGNLLIPGLLPWRVAGVRAPVEDSASLPGAALVGLAAVLLLASTSIRRRQVFWVPFRKLAALTSIFIVFQTVVLVFHPQELTATGFYYGAIFSVLFASLIAVVFADVSERRGGRVPARFGLAWVLVISAMNYIAINASWIAHSNFEALFYLPNLPVHGHGADTSKVTALAAMYERAMESPLVTEADRSYIQDIVAPRPGTVFRETFTAWRRWRQGDADFLAGAPLSIKTMWIAVELDLEDRHTPRHWRTLLPWR